MDRDANHRAGASPRDADAGTIEARVRAELLAARKTSAGLSPHSIALCPTVVALLGNGDPLVAFTQFQSHLLKEIETRDDVVALEAAAFSLGFASAERTHLARLDAFGLERGYEARQARRHSDKGLRQLAHLIANNWNLYMTPVADVSVAEQLDGSIRIGIRTIRPRFIGMDELTIQRELPEGGFARFEPAPEFVQTGGESDTTTDGGGDEADEEELGRSLGGLPSDLLVVRRLAAPLVLRPLEADEATRLRIVWRGEMWPTWQVTVYPGASARVVVRCVVLGNMVDITASPTGLAQVRDRRHSGQLPVGSVSAEIG